mgnify:CR=1 FL=1
MRAGFEKRLAKVLMIRGGTEQGINNLEDDKITLGTGLDISIQQALRIKADFTYVMDQIKDSHRFGFSIPACLAAHRIPLSTLHRAHDLLAQLLATAESVI